MAAVLHRDAARQRLALLLALVQVFLNLVELSAHAIDHEVFFFGGEQQRRLLFVLRRGLLRFAFGSQPIPLQVFLETLGLEPKLINFGLQVPPLAPLLLDVSRVFYQQVVPLDLKCIAFLSEFVDLEILVELASLEVVKLTPQPPDTLLVFLLVHLELQAVVLFNHCVELSLVASPQISNNLFCFGLGRLMGVLYELELAPRLVQAVCGAVEFAGSLLQLKPKLLLDIFLQAHAQDVCVDGQLHLLSEHVEFALLALEDLGHLR